MNKFQKGDRVQWSDMGEYRCRPRTDPNRVGTIIRPGRESTNTCDVLWDGRKKPESIHRDFLKKVDM